MKKKIIIMFLIILLVLIVVDTVVALIINKSPLLSIKSFENNNLVKEGIFIDTYYCDKYLNNKVIVQKAKGSKFKCPVYYDVKLKDFSFSANSNHKTKLEKTFAFKYNNLEYYYGQSNYSYLLTSHNFKYQFDKAIMNETIKLDSLLDKANKVYTSSNGDVYDFGFTKIVLCNNKKEVIMGYDNIEEFCKSLSSVGN